MNEEFTKKLSRLNKKEELVDFMNQLDEEKRGLKVVVNRFSNENPENGGLQGRERFTKLRNINKRVGYLIKEREEVRQKLGKVKGDQKAFNKASTKKVELCQAFVAAAERTLTEEQFLEIEIMASNMLMDNDESYGMPLKI